MKDAKVKVECPRCCGKKTINGFQHIQNGICFQCNGAGTLLVSAVEAKEMGPTEYQIKCAEWILNCTEEQLIKLTFRQISKARDFAHSRTSGYSTLLEIWREKCETVFQAKQADKLEAYYQENPVY